MSKLPLTDEQREHIRQGVNRFYESPAGQARIRELQSIPIWNKGTGKPKPPSRVIKAVLQYNKNLVFIRRWPSVTAASRKLGINLQGIWYVANGRNKSAGGFIWRYDD
jgi:hypothetical protein